MKEKSTARISTDYIWLFILLGELLLLLFTGTSFAAKLLVAFNTVESSCRKDPLGNVNISLASPWLKNPVGICSMLSWRNVLRIHNTSQFSARMNCSELDGAFDSLSKVSTAFNEFSSAVESFDCSQRYSVKKNCSQCLNAYKQWLCFVEFFKTGVKPCLDICYDVYRSCPAFEPEESYGGYNMFECPKEGDEYSAYGLVSDCTSPTSLPKDRG